MDDNLLKFFIAVTAVAVVIQAGILVALYLSVRKSTAKMEALATEVTSKALPTMETVQSMHGGTASEDRNHRAPTFPSPASWCAINSPASTPRSPTLSTARGCKSSAPTNC